MSPQSPRKIAIACGGTGGHLFPGVAVGEQLVRRGCAVTLLISAKDIDQQAVRTASGMQVVTLPGVGLGRGRLTAFARGCMESYRAARKHFQADPPDAVLAMGGFTSAPPILAGKKSGARTFLHESNTIPGRATRWLSWVADQIFVGFPQAGAKLHNGNVTCTGTPVRPQFQPRDAAVCRTALGLEADRPVLLVMGGSQGASGLNELVMKTLPVLAKADPARNRFQLLHLAGPNDSEKIRNVCATLNVKAIVHPFLAEMDLALGAATVAVSRAGASSFAELAAMRVPSILVPFPAATDNHQFYNARAFETDGAARLLEQNGAKPETLAGLISELLGDDRARATMQAALAKWHSPKAAEQIAETILTAIQRWREQCGEQTAAPGPGCGCGRGDHRVELRAKSIA